MTVRPAASTVTFSLRSRWAFSPAICQMNPVGWRSPKERAQPLASCPGGILLGNETCRGHPDKFSCLACRAIDWWDD